MVATKVKPTPNSPEKIQLERLSHVYIRHVNVQLFLKFAADFGFVEEFRDGEEIYLRGYGKDPYCYVVQPSTDGKPAFDGGAFVVRTKDDLEKAARLPGAVRKDLSHLPSGGELVSFKTPAGATMHLVWGQKERKIPSKEPSAQAMNQGPYNLPFTKERKGNFQRFQPGPAMVHKLGHFGFTSGLFDEEVAFYFKHFNLTPSDTLFDGNNPEVDIMVFLHIDLGDDYSDHHSLFVQRVPSSHATMMHHCSFEVADFDTQLLGHQWLLSKGYDSLWGVGRHILGSQIFDYWRDLSGFRIEHYADGDVVNQKTPTTREAAGPDSILLTFGNIATIKFSKIWF
ncbi:Glyoxalase/Bleomycin resistance protein/Dihydroxybiphenyl dioxygenase [Cadophora sp. DSE1049]|nr:Glyoxalase/Bleomycin resistance protein/Dihydroxybiphenyl dioxygenase [Cadophora sp. DSE1049]